MNQPFSLSIGRQDGGKVIEFANGTSEFVEVVFELNGREVKYGRSVSADTRGYAYPPGLKKPVRKMIDDSPLPFRSVGGMVRAYIFPGTGTYKEEDLNIPTFLRKRAAQKISFRRIDDRPMAVLEARY